MIAYVHENEFRVSVHPFGGTSGCAFRPLDTISAKALDNLKTLGRDGELDMTIYRWDSLDPIFTILCGEAMKNLLENQRRLGHV